MMLFEEGAIVRVLFPHVERNVRRSRPALVLTPEPLGPNGLLIWAAMITSAERDHWPGDLLIDDLVAAGLPIASIVRTSKIATLEAASASPIGRLPPSEMSQVRERLATHLGFRR